MRKVALLLLISFFVSGCHHRMGPNIKGSGNRQSQKREIAPFSSISTQGAFTIEVVCQKDLSLEVEGDDNVLPLITAEVRNNVLRLSNNGSYSTDEPVKFKISVPNLEGLDVEGAGKIDIKGMNNDKFEIDADGAPNINVSGNTKLVDIHSNGAGKINTNNLNAARAVVNSNGATQVELDVKEQLDVTVNGPSSVTYKGDPVVNKNVNGPGKVERRASEGA
ncbi:MAG TPA: head GIN domain-containing protein [Pyrinomonadaceae bacterium]|nr:head GIN domain-containing protein [Pyrinomonadaceae bacterium]